MKTRTLLAVFLLAASCKVETQGYIVDNLNFELEDDDFEFNSGEFHKNQLPGWLGLWSFVGIDSQPKIDNLLQSGTLSLGFELEINNRSETGTVLRAFRATPEARLFDGSDLLTAESEVFSFVGESFREEGSPRRDGPTNFVVRGERFEWLVVPLESDVIFRLPLTSVVIRGAISTNSKGLPVIDHGVLSGLLSARDMPLLLEQMPAFFDARLLEEASAFTGGDPLPCQQINGVAPECIEIADDGICSNINEDGVSTGFCVGAGGVIAAAIEFEIDADGDSHYVVDYDEETETFLRNDLSKLFDLVPGEAPGGMIGLAFFTVDSDLDGTLDAMPVAIGFSSVGATLAP